MEKDARISETSLSTNKIIANSVTKIFGPSSATFVNFVNSLIYGRIPWLKLLVTIIFTLHKPNQL